MRITFTIAVILVVAGIGGLAGGAIGHGIGTWAPDYYRVVFHVRPAPPLGEAAPVAAMDFDPVQVGTILGFTQGLVAGMVVGIVAVLVDLGFRVWVVRRRSEGSE